MTPTQTAAALAAADPDPSDADLLGRFAAARDEAAFAAVVRRHARLVWAVCRRAAAHHHDAEDAFQATFLVLAKHPEKPRRAGSAAGFLFGVARRLAGRARRKAARTPARLAYPLPDHTPDPAATAAVRELQAALDDEIARLPAAYREAFLACVIGGRSRERAAAELGVNPGTLSARLARARLLLRDRLAKRGVQLSAALAVADLAATAAPPGLVRSAVAAGLAGRGARGGVSWGAVAAGLAGCVVIAAALSAGGQDPPPARPPALPAPAAAGPLEEPLPAGAVARLGSTRWRHPGEAQSVSLSPDGAVLAVLSGVGSDITPRMLTLFDGTTGRVLQRQTRPEDRDIAFSPDGASLALLLSNGSVELRHPRTLELLRTLAPAHADGCVDSTRENLVFSPNGRRLAASTGRQRDDITVWDVPGGRALTSVTGHNYCNPPKAFTPDGTVLVLRLSNPNVQFWDATTGKKLRGFDTGVSGWMSAMSRDGAVIATSSETEIVLSDTRSGKELGRLRSDRKEVISPYAFTPDGKGLVCHVSDAKALVYDLVSGKVRHVFNSRGWIGRSMAMSADGRRVAVGTVYNIARVWDVATGQEISGSDDGHDAPVRAVAVAPDGKTFVTGGANQQLRVWDAATGRLVRRLPGASASQVTFSADGRRLVTAWEWGDKARVWDVARGEHLADLPAAGHTVPLVAFTPDGAAVVMTWRKEENNYLGRAVLRVCDPVTGKSSREFPLMKHLHPSALAVSPDGAWVAVGATTEPGLLWWDLRRNRERVGPSDCGIGAAAFSPDGRLLATGGIDRKARLWETATGREMLALEGHERSVTGVGFTPDGRVLVSVDGGPESVYWKGYGPQSVRFWDVATGRELARLGGHAVNATSLAITPDGTRVLTGLDDGSTLIWAVPPAAAPPRPAHDPRGPADLWADLASDDAPTAYAAVRGLAADPDRAVPFLKQ
ncbi:MAG TPA: sigma-70 family RNA polymerase sigma factor [Urbifossiella sp.]|nr:sigma-70 family RNA polymerase sigma factor [Urbifossiella sp.]